MTTPFSKTYRFIPRRGTACLVPASVGLPACEDSFTYFVKSRPALSSPQAFWVSEERACHPGIGPAMCGAGAELNVVFAQPGFQHHQHSSTNGLDRQHEPNATKEEKMTEKQESDITPNSSDLENRVCLVTGATSGIGYITALELARRGATVALAARNQQRAEQSVATIRRETGNSAVDFLLADLSSQEQVRQLADAFKQRYQNLHVLVNNAGGIFWSRRESVDGLEMTLALNHLAPFLLTDLLLPTLKDSTPSRIITVASDAHSGATIHFDDLQWKTHRYQAFAAYGQSKLANILFTYELARQLEGQAITANTLHPGFVASNFGKSTPLMRFGFSVARPFTISPEKGAATSIYLATSPAVATTSGLYFVKEKPARSSAVSYDQDVAGKLWTVSEQLTGLTPSLSPLSDRSMS
jgi:NAD(P)-dependent dehydrogenase (short-subunit alcohol dehydrogenase family)